MTQQPTAMPTTTPHALPQPGQVRRARRARGAGLALAALAVVTLPGCGLFGGKGDDPVLSNPDQLYQQGYESIRNGNYQGAVRAYEALEASFPFTDAARQARLDLMYAYYKAGSTEQAIDAAETFIRENPTHPRLDYAYYVKGLVWFERTPNFFERWMDVDLSERPPQEARQSFQAFATVVTQYPASEYAHDSRRRMVYLRNRLAEYELNVSRWYFRRGADVAALNRARYVLETYDGAPAVRDALAMVIACYDRLDLKDQATNARKVYAANFTGEPEQVGKDADAKRRWWKFWK